MGTARALPHTENAAERCLALPMFSRMTDGQVNEVCGAVRECGGDSGASMASRCRKMLRCGGRSSGLGSPPHSEVDAFSSSIIEICRLIAGIARLAKAAHRDQNEF